MATLGTPQDALGAIATVDGTIYRASPSPFNTAWTSRSGTFRLLAATRGVMPVEIAAWMSER